MVDGGALLATSAQGHRRPWEMRNHGSQGQEGDYAREESDIVFHPAHRMKGRAKRLALL